MYARIISDFKTQFPEIPRSPNLDLGMGIKQIRLRMGMTQSELAQDARIELSALKTLENGYAKFTKASNLDALCRALRIDIEALLLESREWFSGNFFVVKSQLPPDSGKRKKKQRLETWLKQKPMLYDGFSVTLLSPNIPSPTHFCFSRWSLSPNKKAENLILTSPAQVVGFVQRGSMRILYDDHQEVDVFGNQGFSLRGDKKHTFMNADTENPLEFFLAFPSDDRKMAPAKKPSKSSFSIGTALKSIRHEYALSAKSPLSFANLSALTGLDEKSLYYLEKTTNASQVIYWDKIEKITGALGMPFSRFLELGRGEDSGYIRVATAHDRALIDYRHYLGVSIKSTLFPSTDNSYHMAEMFIESRKGSIRRSSWRRHDHAMIALYVADGEIRVEVGKNRKARLIAGESIYFDASLGYIFTNPGAKPCKIMLATSPAIIF